MGDEKREQGSPTTLRYGQTMSQKTTVFWNGTLKHGNTVTPHSCALNCALCPRVKQFKHRVIGIDPVSLRIWEIHFSFCFGSFQQDFLHVYVLTKGTALHSLGCPINFHIVQHWACYSDSNFYREQNIVLGNSFLRITFRVKWNVVASYLASRRWRTESLEVRKSMFFWADNKCAFSAAQNKSPGVKIPTSQWAST